MAVEVTSGSRAEQRRATTLRLEEVALELFAEHGYDNVTTAQIAAAAEVSHRTFFRHFPGGKEDLLLVEHRESLAEVAKELLARPPHEDILTAVRMSVSRIAHTFERADDVDRALKRRKVLADTPALRGRALAEQIGGQDALIHLVAVRMSVDPDRDLRPRLIVATYLAAIQVALLAWVMGSEEPIDSLCSRALDALDDGLRHAVATASPIPPIPPGR
ncbi:MAG: TetR/AcrR family transcriptional regulator [Acidimicrobiia bacterium]